MDENVFKLLEPQEQLPEQMKQKTMDSLRTVQLILDMVDLFFLKSSLTMVRSFNLDSGTDPADLPSHNPTDE